MWICASSVFLYVIQKVSLFHLQHSLLHPSPWQSLTRCQAVVGHDPLFCWSSCLLIYVLPLFLLPFLSLTPLIFTLLVLDALIKPACGLFYCLMTFYVGVFSPRASVRLALSPPLTLMWVWGLQADVLVLWWGNGGPHKPSPCVAHPFPLSPSHPFPTSQAMGQKISGSIKSVDVRGEPSYRPLRRELRGPDFFKPARLDLLLTCPLLRMSSSSDMPGTQMTARLISSSKTMTNSPSIGTLLPRVPMAFAEGWDTHEDSTFGGSIGLLGNGAHMQWWAWPRQMPHCTRWATLL